MARGRERESVGDGLEAIDPAGPAHLGDRHPRQTHVDLHPLDNLVPLSTLKAKNCLKLGFLHTYFSLFVKR